ncbi:hypothetical protein SOVF_098990 [Spinacia oleracea]|nr:hypothetical protein SOVF_098990 [Spinacia oleracea]
MNSVAKFVVCVLAMTSLLFSVISAEQMPECFIDCGGDIVGCAGKCVTGSSSDMLQCISTCGQKNLKCLAKCTGDDLPVSSPAASPAI